jgi:superfamily II DNA or RNA helicase
MDYNEFLIRKQQYDNDSGFDPLWMPDFLFDFQKHIVEWATRKGRAAIFADCGLGKTPMQLVWAQNVVRKVNKPVLILTPLAVSHQTVQESEKFGIVCSRSHDGSISSKIVVANYERLHYFKPDDFCGVVCDESSILKHFKGKTKAAVTEFARRLPYRLLCTATAAPNDFWELGTSSEALGYLGFHEMLSRFFVQETKKDYLRWGRTKYRFRGHAEKPFWRWVCSWARVCRRPSDLGFQDGDFILPPLNEFEQVLRTSTARPGMLFAVPAVDLHEQRQERRITIQERCERAAEHAIGNGACVIWCHLNDEANVLERIIPEALQVSGSMPEEKKEERLLSFQSGELKTLVTKPKIGCFGLNWQHCHNVVTFPSHSWEQYYQAVRRCWRFGQKQAVDVHIITTEGEQRVLKNLKRKAHQADKMFDALCSHAKDALHIESERPATKKEQLPSWLSTNKK